MVESYGGDPVPRMGQAGPPQKGTRGRGKEKPELCGVRPPAGKKNLDLCEAWLCGGKENPELCGIVPSGGKLFAELCATALGAGKGFVEL